MGLYVRTNQRQLGGIAAAQPRKRELIKMCVRERKRWIKAKLVKAKCMTEACGKAGMMWSITRAMSWQLFSSKVLI